MIVIMNMVAIACSYGDNYYDCCYCRRCRCFIVVVVVVVVLSWSLSSLLLLVFPTLFSLILLSSLSVSLSVAIDANLVPLFTFVLALVSLFSLQPLSCCSVYED